MSTPFTLGQTFYDHGNANGDPDLGGHTTDGGHVSGFTRARYVECDRYDCLPVLVIDPSNADHVAAITEAIGPCTKSALAICGERSCNTSRIGHALESVMFGPKPHEPRGDGAVVEDRVGHRWVRIAGPQSESDKPWRRRGATARDWDHVTCVRVLSEGVS